MTVIMDRTRLRRLVNILLVAATFGSWIYIFFFGTGSLVQNGIGSLRYFTLLSNLFAGTVAAVWLVRQRSEGEPAGDAEESDEVEPGSRGDDGARLETLKFVAAASVGLTCATVLGFLGLLYGYKEMLAGANLFLHLLVPLAAIAEVIFLSDASFTRRHNALAVIPPLLYGIGYLANILINGMGEWPDTNDWYFFFAWGYGIGAVIYVALIAVTWLIGLLMRKLHAKLGPRG